MSKGMKESSKRKQRLYIKFLKNKTKASEIEYKDYKNLFEKLRKKCKKYYYSSLIEKFKNDSKKTWQVMKEITGKTKWNPGNLPKMIKTEKGNIYDQRKIAEEFNTFFTNIGPKLASKITPVPEHFQDYIIKSNFDFDNNELSFKEFDTAFKSLKRNKASGIDDINTNVVIDVYNEIKQPLFKICQNSVKEGTFPDPLKIAKVSPIFKTGDAATLGNYRPISVLPVFSKLLERIMYNRVYFIF